MATGFLTGGPCFIDAILGRKNVLRRFSNQNQLHISSIASCRTTDNTVINVSCNQNQTPLHKTGSSTSWPVKISIRKAQRPQNHYQQVHCQIRPPIQYPEISTTAKVGECPTTQHKKMSERDFHRYVAAVHRSSNSMQAISAQALDPAASKQSHNPRSDHHHQQEGNKKYNRVSISLRCKVSHPKTLRVSDVVPSAS